MSYVYYGILPYGLWLSVVLYVLTDFRRNVTPPILRTYSENRLSTFGILIDSLQNANQALHRSSKPCDVSKWIFKNDVSTEEFYLLPINCLIVSLVERGLEYLKLQDSVMRSFPQTVCVRLACP
jgi:hypothetical protein